MNEIADRRADFRASLALLVRQVLVHPRAMQLKRGIRDVVWHFRSRSVSNPPLPIPVRSILFVCQGNICRSPFAALVTERHLSRAGRPDIRCLSAGIKTTQANRSPAEACAAADAHGVSLLEHTPVSLSPELMAEADLVVAMEPSQVDHIRQAHPARRERVVLLSLFDPEAPTPFERCHISDPFGLPQAAYDYAYHRIDRASSLLVRRVTALTPGVRRA